VMVTRLPNSLQAELHPLCDKRIASKILEVLESNPAICIREAAKVVGCSDITARKHLLRIAKAGLAIEKKIGRTRVFIKSNEPGGADL
jgi:predicted ArsR family transcriptional regulator